MPDMKIRCPECEQFNTLMYVRRETKFWPIEVMENTTSKGLRFMHKLGIRTSQPAVTQETVCQNPDCSYSVPGQPKSSEIVYPVGD